ncbi:MAG TPA: hypothetical protein VJI15_06340 [Candidatus Nanoarchaeia archaeon]|nr:hypothetical protein [Candidatus Nanoarchaeia archaeon]
MSLKEKLISGLYVGAAVIASRLSKHPELPYRELMNGYGHDVALPFGLYFINKLMNHPFAKNPYVNAGTIFLAASALEIGQKFDLPIGSYAGTYDPWDFVAYAVGTGLAIGMDKLTFKKKNLEKIVEE